MNSQPGADFDLVESHPFNVPRDHIKTLLDCIGISQNGKVIVSQFNQLGLESELGM